MKTLIIAAVVALSINKANAQSSNNGWNTNKEATNSEIRSNIEFQTYVKEINEKIALYSVGISDLKVSTMCEQNKAGNKLKRRVATLEKENNELKSDLDDFINYGYGNWKIFKSEFSQDVAILGQDLSEFGEIIVGSENFASNMK